MSTRPSVVWVETVPQPGQTFEWVEPYGEHSEPVYKRMTYEHIAAVRRREEPRYPSDQRAVEDFCNVHWAWTVTPPQFPIDVCKVSTDVEVQAWINENWKP